jgi:hypothetical protein
MKKIKLTKSQSVLSQLRLISEIAAYGLEWSEDAGEKDSYRVGSVETVGHVIACCVCQWITGDSEPTSDVIDFLRLHEYPKRRQIFTRLKKYLADGEGRLRKRRL